MTSSQDDKPLYTLLCKPQQMSRSYRVAWFLDNLFNTLQYTVDNALVSLLVMYCVCSRQEEEEKETVRMMVIMTVA